MKRNRQKQLIEQMSAKDLALNLYATQAVLLMIATIAGIFIFKDISSFMQLFQFDSKWVFIGFINGLAVVVIDIILINILPSTYYDDGGINEKLFSSMPVWKIPIIAIVVAFSEEVLFRGMVQTSLGIVAASLIFAIIHFRYWSHWYLSVNVIILSFWIGLVYEWAGQQLLPVIAMHFTIDFLLGLYIKFIYKDHKKGQI